MIRSKTFFSGGLKPFASSVYDPRSGVQNISLPSLAKIPLLQHTGREAQALVRPGDLVEEGQMLARSPDDSGAHVFASIPGLVRELETMVRADGTACMGINIELGGAFKVSSGLLADYSWREKDASWLRQRIKDLGLVSQSWEALPLHRLLPEQHEQTNLRLIVNALQTDGYQYSYRWCLAERHLELMEALEILSRLYSSKNLEIVFALPEGKRTESKLLRESIHKRSGMRYRFLESLYPQGDSRMLIQALFDKDFPSQNEEQAAGYFILDPETLLSLREGILFSKPQLERIISLSGSAIRNPGLYRVRLGTSLSNVIEESGGFVSKPAKLVSGDPLRGYEINTQEMPIGRDTCAILALSAKEVNAGPVRSCMRCGLCIQSCPVQLEPIRLQRLLSKGYLEAAVQEGVLECSSCGICSQVCPSHIPLTHEIILGKERCGAHETLDSAAL